MRMKKKNVLSTVLAGVLFASCMTGCGSGADTQSASEAPYTEASEAETATAPGEVVNITVLTRGMDGNSREADVIAAMNEYSKEKIGVTITFTTTAAADFAETLSRQIAAKDELDLTFVASYTGFTDLVNKGGLMDLTDLLAQDQFADLRAVMPEEIWTASSVGGKNYCVPNYKETPFAETLITPVSLADTIKEKYGIDFNALQIESFRDLDKLEEYLLAAQAEGVKYPALTNEQDMSLSALLKSDTEYELIGTNIFTPYVINKQTHQVSNIFENPDFLSYFETMARWNDLGLWSEDNIPLDWNPRDFVNSADYAIYPANAVPDNAAQQSATFGHDVYSIYITPATILSTGALGSTWAIPAYSQKAEAALKWVQLLETDQAFADLFIFGIEDVDYTRDSADVVTKISDSGWKNFTWKVTSYETPSILSSQAADLKQQYRDFNAQGVLGVLASFTPVYDAVESEMASVSAVYNEEYHLYTLGFYTPDHLADTVARYKAAGDDAIIAELQRQVDEYLAQ